MTLSIRAPAEVSPYAKATEAVALPREPSPLRAAAHQAQLAVRWQRTRSVVTQARSAGPFRLLAPAGTGRAAWVYQSSLGGGFVSDDDVALEAQVGTHAALFLSSQSSKKIYRGARSAFTLDA